MKNKKAKLLSALFAKAATFGISREELRESIAPNVIGKRLSQADNREIFRVLEHVVKIGCGLDKSSPYDNSRGRIYPTRYKASKKGLLQELEDIAKERWGEDYQRSLNAFVNSHLKTPTHYKFLNIGFLKRIKERIKEMNSQDEVA